MTFTALADLCINAGVQTGLGGGTPPEGSATGDIGVYSGPGVTDDGNGMTYSFDPAAAGVGTHTITYTYTDENGCTNIASDDVEVFALPTVTFTAPADLCIDAGVQIGLGGGTPSGGVYSGPGVTDDGNGMTYSFDPAVAGVGVHTITYAYTDTNGCSLSSSDMVEVYALPVVSMATALGYCIDAPIQNAPISGGSPVGGVYSGPGVTDLGNGSTYNFDPIAAGTGVHAITYTYTDSNGCVNSATSNLEVFACEYEITDPCDCLDNATAIDVDNGSGGDDGQFSEIVAIANATGSPLPAGQTWSVVGGFGAFDAYNVPAVGMQSAGVPVATDGSVALTFNAGIYEMPFVHVDNNGYTLMIEGPFPMGSAANVILTVSNNCQYPNPVFDPMLPDTICSAEPSIVLGGMDVNGNGADNISFAISGMPSTEFNPGVLAPGTYTVVMTFDGMEDGNGGISPDGGTTPASPGCIQTVQKTVEVLAGSPPSIVCPADNFGLAPGCNPVLPAGATTYNLAGDPNPDPSLPTIMDGCGMVTLSFADVIVDVGCMRTVTRTYTVTDQVGDMASCDQIFTFIVDMEGPMFTIPGDITVECDMIPEPPSTAELMISDNCGAGVGDVLFINEIHYDNTGGDVGEFVEVAGTAGIDLSNCQLVAYNGSNGQNYGVMGLSGILPDEGSGYGAISFSYPTNGLQNGAPDGIALVCAGEVLEFLSYEGSFMATNGPAMGMMSVDIGVSEGGGTAIGQSLQRTGTSCNAFGWTGPLAESPGVLNVGQLFDNSLCPMMFDVQYSEVISGVLCTGAFIERTWTVTDACGNASMQTQRIDVTDTTAPEFCSPPSDVTISCDEPLPAVPVVTAVDNCHNGGAMSSVWINELHYDNVGADVGEFIEIAGNAGIDLSGYSLVLYNGANGQSSGQVSLAGVLSNESCGVGAMSFAISGIMNGAPDGVALLEGNTVLEFISWEGSFMATNGPAVGMMSVDIGVSESSGTAIGLSLQKVGSGLMGIDFSWTGPVAESPGSINTGQLIEGPLTATYDGEVTLAGNCPQEMTITRTWSISDVCGNPAIHTQVITVVDTVAPMMICQDVTVELDANGMGSITVGDVDNGSSDNCSNEITLSLSQTSFDCDDIGSNNVWLYGEDECGNVDSCMAVITVEDNILPTIVCPADMTVSTDDGLCEAVVDYVITADDNCNYVITQLEGLASGESFPQGTTTNTYMVTDDGGNTATCSFDITVYDDDPPIEIMCPDDIVVNLGPGECDAIVNYEIMYQDNCSMNPVISQNVNGELIDNSVDCIGNLEAIHVRRFDNSANPYPLIFEDISYGVFTSGAGAEVTVNVYSIPVGADLLTSNMTLEGSTVHNLPGGITTSIVVANVPVRIEPGNDFVLEVVTPLTPDFVMGYNSEGQTDPSYVYGCGFAEPTDLASLGFPADFSSVLYLSDVVIVQTAGQESGTVYERGITQHTFIVTDGNGNTSECSFTVEVIEYQNPISSMVCNDGINISLDQNCEALLTADMLLEGGPYGCYDDYIIEIPGVVGSVITDPGEYVVTITDPDTGNSCWSVINVEDKRPPVIDCEAAQCGLATLVGEWTSDDPTFSPGAPWAFDGGAPQNDILYDVIEFTVTVAGDYTFTMDPSDEYDGIAGIYAGSFDPNDAGANLVGGDDDLPGIFESEPSFTVSLTEGLHILVSSTWGTGQMGVYSWTFSGPGELLTPCVYPCYDLEAFLAGDLEGIPEPTVQSCAEYELYYSDAIDNSDCGTTIVTRTYLAVNEHGSASCIRQFEFPSLSIGLDVSLPPAEVFIECGSATDPASVAEYFDNALTTDNPNTVVVENHEGYSYGYPYYTINGHDQKIDNNVCNIYATYTDQSLEACEQGCNGNIKVIRSWSLVNWCNLNIVNYTQVIKAVDTEAPTLISEDITVSVDPWNCRADFAVPAPWELHDNCDYTPEYSVHGPGGVLISGNSEDGYYAEGAPKGEHTFYYTAYDCCGNSAEYPFTVTVYDGTPPVVVAKQNVVVSLTSGGTSEAGLAKLYTEAIDNGSHDGCGPVHLEVRRDSDACNITGNTTYNNDGHPQDFALDPDGGEYVKFCCEDLDNAVVDVDGDGELDAGYVKVWLRAWDDGDMDGVFGSAGDNYNEAWAYVKVEDKLAPSITCPEDVTLTCDMDYTDLGMTGSASGYGTCGAMDVEYNDIIVNLNTCNEGFVVRRWSVVGRGDIFCDQRIDMIGRADEVTVNFTSVGDIEVNGCPDMVDIGEPTWLAGPCDVLAASETRDTFLFEDGACLKVLVNWTVINWCDYAPNDPNWDGEGLWEHVQVVKVNDDTVPEISDCEDGMYEINDHGDADEDGNTCEGIITLVNVAEDAGSENCPTGWLKWQVFVDLWGDGTNDLEYSSFLPPFDNNYNDTNGNGIADLYVAPTESGGQVSITLPEIEGSMSNHKIVWKVTDGCGNVDQCSSEFMVVDKKAPTPYCVNLSTAVMEGSGTVELWAIDFNVGSFDNCTAEEDLRYTFSAVAPEDDPNYNEALQSSSMVFDCDDVANSPITIGMYVWDEKGNSDFCWVELTVVDNHEYCTGGGLRIVGGEILTEQGEGVSEVEVELNSVLPEYPKTEMSDESGGYEFVGVATGVSYESTLRSDKDWRNGLSTLDLVKIQRHILGLELLDSPYKVIAGDVNGDDKLRASDLVILRKLILGVVEEVESNESWRFVDSEREFADIYEPFPLEETMEMGVVNDHMYEEDYIGIKVGDVTGDAKANLTGSGSIEVRGSDVSVEVEDRRVEAGEEVRVTFEMGETVELYGYQFTLESTGMDYVGVESGAAEMRSYNVGNLSERMQTVSYGEEDGMVVEGGEALFTMVYVAKESGQLSEMIRMTGNMTEAEAYLGSSMEVRGLSMEMVSRGGEIVLENALYQNEPNPYKELTKIGYDLAEGGSVTLTISDVSGRVLYRKTVEGQRGYNEMIIEGDDLPRSGVMYYQIESGEFTATKKMIRIE